MTELAVFPLQIQEPAEPYITALSRAEAEQLANDVAVYASVRGMERVLSELQTPFSRRWRLGSNDHMLNVLKGKQVVDLGCGAEDGFRKLLGSKEVGLYIGVDYFLDTSDGFIDLPFGKVSHVSDEEGELDSFLVQGEMLDVVSRLPDESCSFVLNGLDDLIMDSSSKHGQELIRQIHRATSVGGYVMGVTPNYGVLSEFGRHMGYDSYSLKSSDQLVRYERYQKQQ